MVAEDNFADFQQEKEQLYDEQIPQPEKKVIGWGGWTGKGIQNDFKEDPQKAQV